MVVLWGRLLYDPTKSCGGECDALDWHLDGLGRGDSVLGDPASGSLLACAHAPQHQYRQLRFAAALGSGWRNWLWWNVVVYIIAGAIKVFNFGGFDFCICGVDRCVSAERID